MTDNPKCKTQLCRILVMWQMVKDYEKGEIYDLTKAALMMKGIEREQSTIKLWYNNPSKVPLKINLQDEVISQGLIYKIMCECLSLFFKEKACDLSIKINILAQQLSSYTKLITS